MIKERIMQFISNEGLSPSQFAEILGIQRSSISHILSGRNKPSYDFFNKLINSYPNLNLEWFFNGKGKMYKSNKDDNRLLIDNPQSNEYESTSSIKLIDEQTHTKQSDTNVNNLKKVLLLFTNGTFQVYNDNE